MPRLTGAEILWDCLVREGVTDLFGYPGGAILPAYDAMLKYPLRHVLVRHEQGATHMADGYARASGQVGVAVATSGPGATNMVTGIATAMMDSSPIVCITGQVGSRLIGSDAFQETDITGITLPITKHNYLVTRADEVASVVREAFLVAKSGRPGPVLIDITKDAQQSSCEFDWDAAAPSRTSFARRLLPAKRAFGRRSSSSAPARRPLVLAGHGLMLGNATEEFRAFVDKTGVPVAMTLLGIGCLPASHPLNLGMMGMHGEAWVNTAIQEADLLIALGMRFDDRVTGNLKTYAQNARKIHVDIDPAEIDKNVPVDVGIVADVRRRAPRLAARARDARPRRLDRPHRRAQGRLGRPRHPEAARRRPSVRGARDSRPLARDATARPSSSPTSASIRCGRRSTTTTISRARSSPPADSARWASRCPRRSAPRWRAPTRMSGRSSATAASR